ncbi:MAG: nucleoid-associated protein [Flavobacteriales bacterium]|nr:nucleoid-associated protein [Flavobacteriales bacterium]
MFKAFSCCFTDAEEIIDVKVFDTNPTLSKYWWEQFLELEKVHSDEDNTENAFEAIDKTVMSQLKRAHPQDYTHLRNSCVRYFRSKATFEMQNFLDEAIGDYEPYDPKLKIEDVKKQVRELPTRNARKPFDEQFTIVKDRVKARFLTTIKLTEQIDLKLKEDVPDIDHVITAYQDSDGTKYVRIRSEVGYQYFNDRKQK